jgi:ABC-type branched-subunit amino acid transport system substrate-binding protein
LVGPLFAQTNLPTNPAPYLQLRNPSGRDAGSDLEEASPDKVTEVRFGWFGPSDPDDPLSGPAWWAAALAVHEANEQGGFGGRPFRLIPKWSENPWGNGVPQVFRMVYEDKIWALLGGLDGASTHLAEQVVAKARLPLISPLSTDKTVNLAGVPWVFSCAPSDEVLAPPLAQAVLKALAGADARLAVLAATDHDSRMMAKEMFTALSKRHRAPDFKFEFEPGQKAVGPQLAGLRAINPRAILLIAGPEDSAQWVIAIRRQLADVAIFGTARMGRARFLELAGAAAEGVRFPLLWTPDESDPTTRKFIAGFQQRFGHEPDYTAALSFDAARLLIAATRQGGLNHARIRAALIKLSPWQGIAGPVQWDGTGQNLRDAIPMGMVCQGKMVPPIKE